MDAVVLVCGEPLADGELPTLTERDDVQVRSVPSRPGKAELAPVLDGLSGRLVITGSDADLAAAVLRLLRTERLTSVPVAFVPRGAASRVAQLWRLPSDPARALEVALHGEVDPVPLVRDDAGGVLVGRGEFRRVRGVAYCDDDRVLRGKAARLVVTPDSEHGLEVQLAGGMLRRDRVARGRAFQLGCLQARPVLDGVPHPRTVSRWTWYRHTEDLRLVRGVV